VNADYSLPTPGRASTLTALAKLSKSGASHDFSREFDLVFILSSPISSIIHST
jgi:hypothetical protein